MNILLAIDGSSYTKKMLAYLAAHEEMLGTEHSYSAITVQPQIPSRARAMLSKEDLDQYYAEESDKVLAPAVKFLERKGVKVKPIAKVGHAAETIAKVAEQGKYDLIIMGTQGQSALGKLVLGSVSTQVLAKCTIPVLLVR